MFMFRIVVPIRWHDAGTYDANTNTGGPNGSIRNEEEYTHGSNNGLKIALELCGEFWSVFRVHILFLRIDCPDSFSLGCLC